MGGCCVPQSLSRLSDILVEYENFNKEKLKDIPVALDSNNILDFLINKEYYNLLINQIPSYYILIKLTEKVSNSDILSSITKLINWSSSLDTSHIFQIDINTIKKIDGIKTNLKLSTRSILLELKNCEFGDETEILLIKSLSAFSLIAQIIQYHINNKSVSEYMKFNYWNNKNLEREVKELNFQGVFYLLKLKQKLGEIDNKRTNSKYISYGNNLQDEEVQKNVSRFCDIIDNFMECIIKDI